MTDVLPTERMTVDEFEAWLETAPPGRYELVDGDVVAMAAERMRHIRMKTAAFDALRASVLDLPCEALPDGAAVRVDDRTMREPDAALRCGEPLGPDETSYSDPVVIVEVTSPSTVRADEVDKLVDYARLDSLAHYVVVYSERRIVVHHRRTPEGFATAILPGGTLALDPPGIALDLEPILAAAEG